VKISIHIRDNDSYGLSVDPHDPAVAALLAQAPQQRWRTHEWELAITEPNTRFLASQIVARFGKEVDISPMARLHMTKALLEEKLVSVKAKRRAEYTFSDTAPVVDDYEFGNYQPFKHQLVGFDAARKEPFFAQLMEMGTGKTPITIHDICYNAIKKLGSKERCRSALPPLSDDSISAKTDRATGVFRVLIVAPKSVCSNWGKELRKHSTLPYCFGALRGSLQQRLETIREVFTKGPRLKVIATNYESIKKLLEILRTCQFDMVVADESTRIKTPGAERTKAMLELVKPLNTKRTDHNGDPIYHQPKRRILSGQPITKNVCDLYSQFEFLNPGNNPLGFTSFAAFCKRYAGKDPYTSKIVPMNVEELKASVGNYSFIVKKQDCLDLPPKVYQTETVEMTEEQATFYREVEDEILQTLLADTGREFHISANNTLTMLLRLAQITSGYVPEDVNKEDRRAFREKKEFLPNPKLERLVELVDEIVDINGPGQKVLIWACFKHDIKAIESALAEKGISSVTLYGETSDNEREIALSQFEKNDSIRVFIGHPQSGGIGLTLTGSEECPTGTAIYYSRNFSLEQRSQSEDRAHRIGMFRPLTIIDLLSVFPESGDATIDGRILARLIEKKDLAEGFTDAKSVAMSMLSGGKPPAPAMEATNAA